ncbi:MAG: hypothetical protein JF888_06885 [Candidatus Dormibacteraeota bacterium]|uniref:Uncharacterized protein n=1 Tax=Candidatus Dormiibacter inghamiae TaxID=3127013 RepID=A0A934KHR3_9BACT|nr:hypothetical protein [Candidatus Dormibacteraeota bacterium]
MVTARIRCSDGLPNARSPETSPRSPDLLGHNYNQDEAGLISGEPEPVRWMGVRYVQRALERIDERAAATGQPPPAEPGGDTKKMVVPVPAHVPARR